MDERAGEFSMSTRSSQKPSLTAVRGLSLVAALPVVAIGLAGCGGGGSSATSSGAGARTQSGPAIVAAGKGGSGSARAKTGAASATRTTTSAGASTSARATGAPQTTPAKSSGPEAIHRAPSAPDKGLLRRFAGSGNARLGTIVVRSPQVLQWRTARGPIQIFAASGFMLVNSSSPSGSIHLSRGTYRSVRVAAHTSWSIELRTPAP
ncbi:MAG TPA: hypothetical protein VGL68_01470 [Solirubrobacteraceae bacterium]